MRPLLIRFLQPGRGDLVGSQPEGAVSSGGGGGGGGGTVPVVSLAVVAVVSSSVPWRRDTDLDAADAADAAAAVTG